MNHQWPTDPQAHIWGPWIVHTGVGPGKQPTQYRTCCHPLCTAVEYREAARA